MTAIAHDMRSLCSCAPMSTAFDAVVALARGVPPDGPFFRRRGENDNEELARHDGTAQSRHDGIPARERLARGLLNTFHTEHEHAMRSGEASTRQQAFVVARARTLRSSNVFALLHATFAEPCAVHDPLTRFTSVFAAVLPRLQGSPPLQPRCTMGTRTRLAGDFALGALRHDGRWHLNIVDGRARLMAMEVGRRLARSIGKNALEQHLALTHGRAHAAAGLRDVNIDELHASYRVSARSRAQPRVALSIEVTLSGIVDWASALTPSAQAARVSRAGVVLFDSTSDATAERAS